MDKLVYNQQGIQKVSVLSDISFEMKQGEILGIVGESGCGKTTLARILLGLLKPDYGEVEFMDKKINWMNNSNKFLRSRMRMIFQNPDATLNPYLTIGRALEEVLSVHTILDKISREKKINECLIEVGLNEGFINKYPHELSGGEKKRVSIARAFMLETNLIIADEPVASLDASIQSDIIKRILYYRKHHNTSFIIISHDIRIINALCDNIAVMHNGKIVELGEQSTFKNNMVTHEYSKKLLAHSLFV